jgi:hypothetical protein
MKRYNIVDAEMEYKENIKAVESPSGEWVKYEPWMEQNENSRFFMIHTKDNKIIQIQNPKSFLTGKQFAITVGAQPEEPTICAKCKHVNISKVDDDTPAEYYNCTFSKEIDFVTGELIHRFCWEKNKSGSCSGFEPKED